jgi:hypothetical protein
VSTSARLKLTAVQSARLFAKQRSPHLDDINRIGITFLWVQDHHVYTILDSSLSRSEYLLRYDDDEPEPLALYRHLPRE